MTINELVLKICKKEGKKKQVNVAQIREIVGIVCDEFFKKAEKGETLDFIDMLHSNGKRRSKYK